MRPIHRAAPATYTLEETNTAGIIDVNPLTSIESVAMSLLKDPKNAKMLEDFITEHAPLIQKHINILKSQGKIPEHIEVSDLHMAGMRGLIDAVHKYDSSIAKNTAKGEENTFAKYAGTRIRGRMLDHVVDSSGVPRTHMTRAKNIAAMTQKAASKPAINIGSPEQGVLPKKPPSTPEE